MAVMKRKPKVQSITSVPAKKPRRARTAKPKKDPNQPTEKQTSYMTRNEYYQHTSGTKKSPIANMSDRKIKKIEKRANKDMEKEERRSAKASRKK